MKSFTLLSLLIIPFLALSQGDSLDFCGVSSLEEPQLQRSLFLDMTNSENVYWKTIKTVVHVHHTDAYPYSEISEEDVYAAIDDLNNQFSEYLFEFDLLDIDYYDLDSTTIGQLIVVGGDQFCVPLNGYATQMLAQEVVWDREEIMNIHVIPDMCLTVLGFAYRLPGSTNAADGVWVQTDVFGTQGDYLMLNREENKTLVHEVGHYLGLYHVFQGVDNCGEDADADCTQIHDLICDTPPTKLNWSCVDPACPPAWNPIRPWADYVHNNHMDYYIDSCRTAFTYGQFLFMHNWVVNERPTLIDAESFCWGDINGDLIIGSNDLLDLLAYWGEPADGCPLCDLNYDGIIGVSDLNVLLSVWGTDCSGGEFLFIPEPSDRPERNWRRNVPFDKNLRNY